MKLRVGYAWLSQVLHGPWFSMLAFRPVLHLGYLGGKKMRRPNAKPVFLVFFRHVFPPSLCLF